MPEADDTGEEWPTPESGQVRVLLLGTYHMDEPGLDEATVEGDDVFAPSRQGELVDLVDRLAAWAPDRVAVERPHDRHETVAERYDSYRTGERRYDREERMAPMGERRVDPTAACRSEVVHIGFRLADRLDHGTVHPVDAPTDLGNDDLAALEERGLDPGPVPATGPDPDEQARVMERRLAESTVVEFHRWLNREPQLRANQAGLFGELLPMGEGGNYGGPRALARWYERNLRIAHNLWRTVRDGDERLLLLVGNGHVRVLRHLLREAPMFCPVSPLPVLADRTEVGR